MDWKIPEDLPIDSTKGFSHNIPDSGQSAGIVDKCIDDLFPRGGKKPKAIAISLEDYLSRIAMLSRKIKGVKYRKSCWDTITEQHLKKFDEVANKFQKKNNEVQNPITIYGHLYRGFSVRDIRLENEFEVLIYSVRSSLDILTRVISAFLLTGETTLHSHSKLQKHLNASNNCSKLASIVHNACIEWIKELTNRRNAATHYIALTTTSSLMIKNDPSGVTQVHKSIVAIPKDPINYVSIWWDDDIPVLGGTKYSSASLSQNGSTIEAHALFDGLDNLLIRRNDNFPKLPELIDGREYIDKLLGNYEDYIVKVAIDLKTRIC